MLQEKIARLQTYLAQEQQDYLLIGNFGHQIQDDLLYWLILEKLEYGYMLIPKTGKPLLFAISFEVEGLKHKRKEYIDILPAGAPLDEVLRQHIGNEKKIIAIRPGVFPLDQVQKINLMPSLTLTDFTGDTAIIEKKLPKEIERMRQAAALTDIIFSELIKSWNEFYTEADAANYLLSRMAERGIEPSFAPIIASGKNAANPHHRPLYKPLQEGFCVIDFGIRFKGYCSDMTRTIYIGTPNEQEKILYQKLLTAQENTIAKIMPSISVNELEEGCRQELGEELSSSFIHSLGHGLGTQVHELPSVSKKSAAYLQEHMIITIEPGLYVPNSYGMRIEDDILVTEQGYEVLTKSGKTLLVLEKNRTQIS